MLGTSVTVKGGRAVFFEFLRIDRRGDSIVYIAQPRGRAPVEFTLAEPRTNRAIFVNPANDFPRRIIYELGGASLRATIDGGEDAPPGTPPPRTWLFTRAEPAATE